MTFATNLAQIDDVFGALANSSRRTILDRLSGKGPTPISALAAWLKMSVAAVVQHLQILEASGLARTFKRGRVRTCEIDARGFSLAERWLIQRRSSWESRYDRLGKLIAELPPEKKI